MQKCWGWGWGWGSATWTPPGDKETFAQDAPASSGGKRQYLNPRNPIADHWFSAQRARANRVRIKLSPLACFFLAK